MSLKKDSKIHCKQVPVYGKGMNISRSPYINSQFASSAFGEVVNLVKTFNIAK